MRKKNTEIKHTGKKINKQAHDYNYYSLVIDKYKK